MRPRSRHLLPALFVLATLCVSVNAQDAEVSGRIGLRQADGSLAPANVIVALTVGQDVSTARYTRTDGEGRYSFRGVPRGGNYSLIVLMPDTPEPVILTGLTDVRPALRTQYDITVEPADLASARKQLEELSRGGKGAAPNPPGADEQTADLKASMDEAMRLVRIGTKESFQSAIAIFEQVLLKVRRLNEPADEIIVLSALGRSYVKVGERQKAIAAFEAALPLIRARRDRRLEAITLRNIGLTYDLVGEKQKAVAHLEQALAIWHELSDAQNEADTRKSYEQVRAGTYATGDAVTPPTPVKDGRGDRALTLGEEGFALMKQGTAESLRAAIRKMVEARSLFREVGDAKMEALMLGNAANIYEMLGEKDKALEYYEQGLVPIRRAGDRALEGSTLSNIGVLYDHLGHRQKALEYFARALELLQPIGDPHSLTNLYGNLATVYLETGETARGMDYAEKALTLAREYKDPRLVGKALVNLAEAYKQAGEIQKAIETYGESLSPLRQAALPGEVAWALNNMAALYLDLGDRDKALALLNQALPLFRSAGNRAGQARALSALGKSLLDVGDYQRALQVFGEAQPLAQSVGDRQAAAAIHNGLGLTYRMLGQAEPALNHFLQSLRLSREVRDPLRETNALVNLGELSVAANQLPQGAEFIRQALALARKQGDRFIEGVALSIMAKLERQRGNLTESRRYIEAALPLFEERRGKVASQELRASFFSTVQDYYAFYIDLLMRLHKQQPQAGHDGEALQVSERARARSLLEMLAEAGADIRQGVDPKLVERERSLQRQLNAKAQTQMKLLGSQYTEEQAQTIAKEIEALTTELQQVEAQIRQTSPRYAALTQPQPLTLKEIQTQVLDTDTVLLEYSLGAERSYLWAVTPTSIASYELPKRDEIEAAARQVYELMNESGRWSPEDSLDALRSGKPQTQTKQLETMPQRSSEGEQTLPAPEAAKRLTQMLLAPVANQIGNKRLLIVADGVLQYIPFGALPSPVVESKDEYQPLIVQHEIITLPSASSLAVLRREVKNRTLAAKTVAVLADPVFEDNDERVRNSKAANTSRTQPRTRALPFGMERAATESGMRDLNLGIERLLGTRDEARQILALVPADSSKQALDFNANRQTATSLELSQYRYVHFATHGFLDSIHPELSGIVLSLVDEDGNPQDGFLRAHEVYNLKLPAELVVLSACQTGLGKEVKGEGLVGLTRGFMYAGAPRVVVSLWNVDDEATAELMGRFYRGMLKDKLRPAAALRAAQVSLMKEKKWQSPFFWSAFTLQGEWR